MFFVSPGPQSSQGEDDGLVPMCGQYMPAGDLGVASQGPGFHVNLTYVSYTFASSVDVCSTQEAAFVGSVVPSRRRS